MFGVGHWMRWPDGNGWLLLSYLNAHYFFSVRFHLVVFGVHLVSFTLFGTNKYEKRDIFGISFFNQHPNWCNGMRVCISVVYDLLGNIEWTVGMLRLLLLMAMVNGQCFYGIFFLFRILIFLTIHLIVTQTHYSNRVESKFQNEIYIISHRFICLYNQNYSSHFLMHTYWVFMFRHFIANRNVGGPYVPVRLVIAWWQRLD